MVRLSASVKCLLGGVINCLDQSGCLPTSSQQSSERLQVFTMQTIWSPVAHRIYIFIRLPAIRILRQALQDAVQTMDL